MMGTLEQRRARMALSALQIAADPRIAAVVAEHGPVDVWGTLRAQGESTRLGRRAAGIDVEELEAATRRSGARFLMPGDELWPTCLNDLVACEVGDQGGLPMGLWVSGRLELLAADRVVGIVGARAASGYGLHTAQELAADLSLEGWLVLSGLAFGIDAAAHRGALGVGRPTMAVMATGIDLTYPATHHSLRQSIQETGVVITELAPGCRPIRASFLGRNRLIAALSRGTVIVEAGARSGARNTASWAAELGRVVMAVPGPVTSSLSETPHHLIREGIATLVESAEQITTLLNPLNAGDEPQLSGKDRPIDSLPERLRAVREAVPIGVEATAAQLAATVGLRIPEVLAAASELTELGWLDQTSRGWRLPGRV